MLHGLKYFIFINKQVPINFTLWCLRGRLQGMVFSCDCLAIMTLYIITDLINSWCESAPLINTELINCATYLGSAVQNGLNLCSLKMFDLSDTCLVYIEISLKIDAEEGATLPPGDWKLVPQVIFFPGSDTLADLTLVTVSLRLSVTSS